MKYAFWYAAFVWAVRIEGIVIRFRDLSQRKKMATIEPPVPGFWEDLSAW